MESYMRNGLIDRGTGLAQGNPNQQSGYGWSNVGISQGSHGMGSSSQIGSGLHNPYDQGGYGGQGYGGQGQGYGGQGQGFGGQGQGFGGQGYGGQGRFDQGQGFGGQGFGGQNFDPGHQGHFSQGPQGHLGQSGHLGHGHGFQVEGQQRGQRTRWQKENLVARDVMTSNVKTVTLQTSLKDVAQIMKDENVGIVPVIDENRKLLGVVTDRDLVVRTLAGNKNPLEQKVEDAMTDDVEAVTPNESIIDVLELMGSKQIRRVPVVDQNDRLLGIISIGDLATRADNDEELQDALERISARRSFWSRLWT